MFAVLLVIAPLSQGLEPPTNPGRFNVWTGISQNLDVPRDAAQNLRHKLLTSQAAKLIVHGPSGAGKSTLARRVLWDLHCEGELVAIELQNSDCPDEDWEQARRLAKRLRAEGGPSTVLLIDDIHESETIIQRVRELGGDADLRIVATTWKSKTSSLDLGPGVLDVPLTSISQNEADAVAQRLDKSLSRISASDLTHLLTAGQFIVLNVAILEEGALDKFGQRLLDRIKHEAGEATQLYLDLCACSAGDRPIPLTLLNRRPNANKLARLFNPPAIGLAFLVGNDRARSGHRLLAEAVLLAANESRTTRLIELAELAHARDNFERRFAIGVLEDCIESDQLIGAHGPRLVPLLQALATSGDYLDIRRCVRILNHTNQTQAALQMEDLLTFDRVRTGPDAAAYRSKMETSDPERTFDYLLGFYRKHPTTWGWRNFLRLASGLDTVRRHSALSTVQRHLDQADLAEGDAKVIIDLLRIGQPPENASDLVTVLLRSVPNSVSVARAATQLIKDRLRSADLFRLLLSYSLPLIGTEGEHLVLARNLASAARFAHTSDRRQLLAALKTQFPLADQRARASLLHACAALAAKRDVESLLDLAGNPAEGGMIMNMAIQILQKKAAAAV